MGGRLRPRNLLHLRLGPVSSCQLVLPVLLHVLEEDLAWANDSGALSEVLELVEANLSAMVPDIWLGGGSTKARPSQRRSESDAVAVGMNEVGGGASEKRIFGRTLQLLYGLKPTGSRYDILPLGGEARKRTRPDGTIERTYDSATLCGSTLLLWAFRFDPENPHRPLPTEVIAPLPPAQEPEAAAAAPGAPVDGAAQETA